VPDRLAWRLRLTLLGALGVFAVILVVFLSPWGTKMIDLDVYRAAAHAVVDGADPYGASGPYGLPFTYPIFAAVVFVPFALLPTLVARGLITIFSFAALVAICHITARQILPTRSDRQLALLSLPAAVLLVSAHPVLDTLLFGQINLVLVALVLIDMFVLTGRTRGVLVGLAAGIKLTPGLFIIYYLITGQRRAARTAAITFGLTVAAGLALRPPAGWQFWTRYMLDPARTGNVTYVGNQSILAITARLTRQAHPSAVLVWTLTAIVVAVALILARRLYASGAELAAVSVVATGALLASPISWTHHWVWFIPAAAVVAAWVYRRRSGWGWAALGIALLVLWSGPMRFMPKNDLRELSQTPLQQLITNSFGLLAVAFLVWAGLSLRGRGDAGRRARPGTGTGAGAGAPAGRDRSAGRGQDVDHEPQRAGGGAAGRRGVGQALRDVDLDPAADLLPDQGLVPTLDDLTGSDLEVGRAGGGVVPAGVELLAGRVVHPDVVD
jgi:alpha-1,2-mannosyltransferase